MAFKIGVDNIDLFIVVQQEIKKFLKVKKERPTLLSDLKDS